jgi:small subunit ribosomal protein S17e
MGKIRTKDIKDSAWKLYEKMPKIFSKSFDENKKLLREKSLVERKSTRNKIAGYLVRIVRQSEVKK